jgi:hypothetical protein
MCCYSVGKAAAKLEPETTQHNSQNRLQTRKQKSKTLLFMSAAETDPTGMLSPPIVWRQQSEFVLNPHSGQIPAAVCIGFECCCNEQNVSNRTF